jgi:ketosteroid isomerase-like protein
VTANSDIVRNYFRCLDADKFTELAQLFDEAGVVKMPGARPVTGPAEIERKYARALPGSFSAHRAEILSILEDGELAVAVLRVRATSASGADNHVFTAVDVFNIRNGKITSLEVVLDRKLFVQSGSDPIRSTT